MLESLNPVCFGSIDRSFPRLCVVGVFVKLLAVDINEIDEVRDVAEVWSACVAKHAAAVNNHCIELVLFGPLRKTAVQRR